MKQVRTAPRPERIASTFLLSYAIGFGLLGVLVWYSGVWDFLANTRLLDPMVNGGVVALRDDQPGFISGVPELKYWVKSQDPIDWPLVFVAIGLFGVFFWVKAVQYHGFARFLGIPGSFGDHSRAYLYGQTMQRVLPFNAGKAAMASAFASLGGSIDRSALLVFLGEMSMVFQAVVFAVYALYDIGWGLWLAQLFWPLAILFGAWLFLRRSGSLQGSWNDWKAAMRALGHEPRTLGRFALLGLVAFALEDVAAFVIAMAFTGDRVIIDVPFGVLTMAVVAGYLARLIPVTPGGIGQFEWAFAMALYWGGLGLPECVTLAVLDNAIRYGTGALLTGAVMLGRGVDTNWPKVRALYAGASTDPG